MRVTANNRTWIELEITFMSMNNSFLHSFISVLLLWLRTTETTNREWKSFHRCGTRVDSWAGLLGLEAWASGSLSTLPAVWVWCYGWGRDRAAEWRQKSGRNLIEPKSRCCRAAPFLDPQGELVSFPFPVSRGNSHFLARGPFPLQSQQCCIITTLAPSPVFSLTLSFSFSHPFSSTLWWAHPDNLG